MKSFTIKDTEWDRRVTITSYDHDTRTLIGIIEDDGNVLTVLVDTAELKERVQAL